MSNLWIKAMYGEEDDPDNNRPVPAYMRSPEPHSPNCGDLTGEEAHSIQREVARDRNRGFDECPEGKCPTPQHMDIAGEKHTYCPGHENPDKGYSCFGCSFQDSHGVEKNPEGEVHHHLKPEDIRILGADECKKIGGHSEDSNHVTVNYGEAHHPNGGRGAGASAVYGINPDRSLSCWQD